MVKNKENKKRENILKGFTTTHKASPASLKKCDLNLNSSKEESNSFSIGRGEDRKLPSIINCENEVTQFFIYDIEVFPNYFLATFWDLQNGGKHRFELYYQKNKYIIDDIQKLIIFLDDKRKVLIGFNNSNYDDLILKYIKKHPNCSNRKIFELSKSIVTEYKDRNELEYKKINSLKYYIEVSWKYSIDLFNAVFKGNGGQSLKALAIKVEHPKIQELPIPFDKPISETDRWELIQYNLNDLEITKTLFEREEVQNILIAKKHLSDEFGTNYLCIPDSKIGEDILLKKYSGKTGISFKEIRNLSTPRTQIVLAEIIPDWIKFNSEFLNDFFKELKSSKLQVKDGEIDIEPIKREFTFRNLLINFSSGGLHSVDEAKVIESDTKFDLIDGDVTSYYPNIIMQNRIKPEHLDDVFFTIFEDLINMRVKAKEKNNKALSDGLKIAINSIYGKLGYKFSWLFDVKAQLAVTLIGQLALLMLIEKLIEGDIFIVSVNTDGVLAKVSKENTEKYFSICHDWEKITGFQLEYNSYMKYIARDVNNYLAINENNSLKTKGIFAFDLFKKADCVVIRKVIQEYFVNNIPVNEYIKNARNIHDFLFFEKSKKRWHISQNENSLQNTNRWYKSIIGCELTKYDPEKDKRMKVTNSDNAVVVNDIDVSSIPADIDYDFYISKANELINAIEGTL